MAILKPTYMIGNTFNLAPQKLKLIGVTHILSDLDNTLIPWDSSELSEDLVTWVAELKKYHIELIIVSNNNYQRIYEAVKDLDVRIIPRAKKPLPFEIKKFVNKKTVTKNKVLFVGDQLLTDVIAGNLSGIRTVLVKPLVDTDMRKTRINRFFERPILKLLTAINKDLTWKEHI